ncbi:Arylsulfatase [Synechococcus sp. MIT S9509]|uniref:sulfatase-like hydrolase/transferase n=1 Tax=Synechococcus sp. MIT S9509 TaxID=1801630 RepID=UPI0007BBA54E|nr:sulfatase-like hydrolase/transferase [Synechococcus sp. MIT S9509]KZR91493.1 Arylsulfatase [Synechococcus sp. MIT S9509]
MTGTVGNLSWKADTDRPNIVLMLADNIGFGDLGCYGSGGDLRGMPTPNLDDLAEKSLMLTQFFVEPGCTPSRAGLMTGRYSVRSGLNSIIVGGTPSTLQEGELTLAEICKENGYSTGMVGKWHLGEEEQSIPTRQGFDSYRVGILETTDATLYPQTMRRSGLSEDQIEAAQSHIWESNDDGSLRRVRPYDLAYRRHVEGDIADAATSFIKEKSAGDDPFFLYVGWSHVHYPEGAHRDFENRSSSGPYGDMLMEHDHRVGQVVAAVEAAGIRDNTIIIYLSDNGPVQNQVISTDFKGSSPGPFRGEVGDVLEGSLRVPGMVSWPGNIPARKSNEMVSIHDFVPTIAGMLGSSLPDDRPYDGVNQWKFFVGESERSSRDHLITFIGGEIAAVRWKQWRIYPKQVIQSQTNPSSLGVCAYRVEGMGYPSVFHIERDPREEFNVVGTCAWVLGPYMKIVGNYITSIKEHPNPSTFSMTSFTH